MFYAAKDKARRFVFDFSCKKVLLMDPPDYYRKNGIAILTMLQSKDVMMYLLALRSFVQHVKVERIFVLDDGTLTSRDLSLLRHAFPDLVLLTLADCSAASLPSGGCWERIYAISRLVQEYFVIQLDGDTLTLREPEEVLECLATNTSFTLGTSPGQSILPMRKGEFLQEHRKQTAGHVQTLSERAFELLKKFGSMMYVRGCAGFAGFGKNSFHAGVLEELSQEMHALIGDKWHEWGSEQVMSNLVVANAAKSVVLPFPKYCSVDALQKDTHFLHFIGSQRFQGGTYVKLAKGFLRRC